MPATGKTYFLDTFPTVDVMVFDQTSLAQTASLGLVSVGQATATSGTQMVRWGGNGFAMRTIDASQP